MVDYKEGGRLHERDSNEFDKRVERGYDRFRIQVSPKNWPKVCVFRIFCELLAKTGLGSRRNTGFLKGYRRNVISPT